jgi:exopolyphosphatase/guanosine-5'-triphosphate,3'-diphosphate pyrophosphatase
VSTISALEQRLTAYDRDRLHHSVLAKATVDRWCATLAAEPAAARAARPGVVAGREDVIVGGALVLSAVMERFSFAECLVSESDILDGLIASQRP